MKRETEIKLISPNDKKTERNCTRLRPLMDRMREDKVSKTLLAEMLGIHRQSLNLWFVNDDTALSKMEKAADRLGCRLEWRLIKDNGDGTFSEIPDVALPLLKKRTGIRLQPLLKAIYAHGLNVTSLANIMEVDRRSLNKVFIVDDTNLSRIEAIAKTLGCEVRMELVKNTK